MCKEGWCVGLGSRGIVCVKVGGEGGGDVVNTLRWGGIEKRGKKVRILKRGAKLVHGVGP